MQAVHVSYWLADWPASKSIISLECERGASSSGARSDLQRAAQLANKEVVGKSAGGGMRGEERGAQGADDKTIPGCINTGNSSTSARGLLPIWLPGHAWPAVCSCACVRVCVRARDLLLSVVVHRTVTQPAALPSLPPPPIARPCVRVPCVNCASGPARPPSREDKVPVYRAHKD